MRRLDRLKHEARRSARRQGHSMGRFSRLGPHAAHANCTDIRCGAGVVVDKAPPAQGRNIHGEAVDMECVGRPKQEGR